MMYVSSIDLMNSKTVSFWLSLWFYSLNLVCETYHIFCLVLLA